MHPSAASLLLGLTQVRVVARVNTCVPTIYFCDDSGSANLPVEVRP